MAVRIQTFGWRRPNLVSHSKVYSIPSFYLEIFVLLTVLLKHLLLANCVIVDQAVVQLNSSAQSSVANSSYNECTKSNLKIYQIYTKFISITKTYNLTLFFECLFVVSRE